MADGTFDPNNPQTPQAGSQTGKPFLTPDQTIFGSAMMAGTLGSKGFNTPVVMDAVKNFGQKAENYLTNGGRLGNLAGFGANILSLHNMYRDASTPSTDPATARNIKIIDNDNEVEMRPMTPQEAKRDAASYGIQATLLGSLVNPTFGAAVGQLTNWGAEKLLEGSPTPKDFYVRRRDLDEYNRQVDDWNTYVEDVKKNNDTPSID